MGSNVNGYDGGGQNLIDTINLANWPVWIFGVPRYIQGNHIERNIREFFYFLIGSSFDPDVFNNNNNTVARIIL